jgi:predicted HTH domain antitoxin
MELKIELPEDIKRCLERDLGDVSRRALEGLAIEGYRAGVLSRAQVRRMLGFETRAEVDEFMARHAVPFDYTVEDFELDAETSRHLRETRSKELQRR